MKRKSLLMLFVSLVSIPAFTQTKVFQFNEILCRNNHQEWQKTPGNDDRVAYFSDAQIDLTLDQYYHLNIVNTTVLPHNGAIFLCKDDQQNDVTVMLIDDEKMYLYNDSKRFLVNFKPHYRAPTATASFADSSDD